MILEAIRASIYAGEVAPSLTELMKRFSFASKRAVTYHLEVLERKGYIKRLGGARGIELSDLERDPQFVTVPVLGYANAGLPLALAQEEYLGEISIQKKIASGSKMFAVEIKGDSMNNRKINGIPLSDGNYAIISKETPFEPRDVVLAVIDEGATIKTFLPQGELIVLSPESTNPKNKPIYLTEDSNSLILGKVVAALPNT